MLRCWDLAAFSVMCFICLRFFSLSTHVFHQTSSFSSYDHKNQTVACIADYDLHFSQPSEWRRAVHCSVRWQWCGNCCMTITRYSRSVVHTPVKNDMCDSVCVTCMITRKNIHAQVTSFVRTVQYLWLFMRMRCVPGFVYAIEKYHALQKHMHVKLTPEWSV